MYAKVKLSIASTDGSFTSLFCSLPDRETLLGQLSVYIKQTRDDYMQRTSSGGRGAPKGKNLPESVNTILWVRQLEAKVGNFVVAYFYFTAH